MEDGQRSKLHSSFCSGTVEAQLHSLQSSHPEGHHPHQSFEQKTANLSVLVFLPAGGSLVFCFHPLHLRKRNVQEYVEQLGD